MTTNKTSIRVSTVTRSTLRALADESGSTVEQVLDKALKLYRRQKLLEETNAAYAALRADPEAWAEVEAERRAWDATLDDGLKS